MKKTAILLYNDFCNFEIAPLLEMLKIYNKEITIFAKSLEPVTSEEGLKVILEKSTKELNVEKYDSLVLPGALDIGDIIDSKEIMDFIKSFKNLKIGAISIAPILLLKCGMLKNKRFMAGVNKSELVEEGFSLEELLLMTDWDENIKNPVEKGYIIDENIITSISYNFLHWTIGFGKFLGLDVNSKIFGL